jgi:hypothetical protein
MPHWDDFFRPSRATTIINFTARHEPVQTLLLIIGEGNETQTAGPDFFAGKRAVFQEVSDIVANLAAYGRNQDAIPVAGNDIDQRPLVFRKISGRILKSQSALANVSNSGDIVRIPSQYKHFVCRYRVTAMFSPLDVHL